MAGEAPKRPPLGPRPRISTDFEEEHGEKDEDEEAIPYPVDHVPESYPAEERTARRRAGELSGKYPTPALAARGGFALQSGAC